MLSAKFVWKMWKPNDLFKVLEASLHSHVTLWSLNLVSHLYTARETRKMPEVVYQDVISSTVLCM